MAQVLSKFYQNPQRPPDILIIFPFWF